MIYIQYRYDYPLSSNIFFKFINDCVMILWKKAKSDSLYILFKSLFSFLTDKYLFSFLKYFMFVSNRRIFSIIDILISNNWLVI